MDSAPPWVGQKYPDSLFVSSNGQAIRPESSPGYCRDHPGVRAADNAFYAALAAARQGAARPSSAGISGASRTSSTGRTRPGSRIPEFCFCANTVRRFRGWLQKKYGIHREPQRRVVPPLHVSWDEVEPSRMSTILSYTDYIDWKAFIVDKLGEDLRDRYQAVKTVAPRPSSPAMPPAWACSPRRTTGKDRPTTGRWRSRWTSTARRSIRSIRRSSIVTCRGGRRCSTSRGRSATTRDGTGFWIGELQGGFGTIALNVSPTVTAGRSDASGRGRPSRAAPRASTTTPGIR